MNINTPIDCNTGYGNAGYQVWKHIYQKDPNTALFLIGNGNIDPLWNKEEILSSLNNQLVFDKKRPFLKIWHSNDLVFRPVGSSKYGVLTFFELDKVLPKDRINFNYIDMIFVASKWAKKVLEDNNIKKPIHVAPQGVDTKVFNAETPQDKPKDKYIFTNIGKWEVRKGHDILVQMFNDAFTEKDDVELWMINSNPFLSQEEQNKWIKLYLESKLKDKIKIFPRLQSQSDVAKAIGYSDCGIYPSRAEGWNCEAMETLAMNKPLIISNYSAHTEYCNKENSYLIDIAETEPASDGKWFHGDGNWAFFGVDQMEQCIEHMRYVYNNRINTNPSGFHTAQEYPWSKTAEIIIKHLGK